MSAASKKEKQSLGDWLHSKMMHNALWDGDEEAGYELFFVEAMAAREKEKQKAYEEQEREKKS